MPELNNEELEWISTATRRECMASIADLDPGSGAFLTPGSGKGFFRIPDLGSQTHIFESLMTIFLSKKFYKSLKIGTNFFLQHFKNKIILNFVKFVATKKRYENKSGITSQSATLCMTVRYLGWSD